MSDLLQRVVDAHGGIDRWNKFKQVQATIVTGGELWGIKGQPQDSTPRLMKARLREEWASVSPYGAPDRCTSFTPERIAIETLDGDVLKERVAPRQSFKGHVMTTPWDPLDRAYFNGYAMWTYLTTPFLLTLPGVSTQEIDRWDEGGESWRGLRATFPAWIATHSKQQDFYFDDSFLIRRHDYVVEIAGSFAAAQYVSEHVEVDGLKLPTRRRAYLRDDNQRPLPDRLLVSIDLSEIEFS
ncbi:hypothetical protein P3T18_003046 [Paraburkholderia sp. GAS199]|uniref:hypothetical protein n=1 Tax=Paraburkholderia sp. GAS199 TaxID=3035126 RepID=UPI003D1E01FB